MKTNLDCIPCLLKQALQASRMANTDVLTQEHVLRATLDYLSAEKQWSKPPALLAARIQNLIITLTGVKDPFKEVKYLSNEEALKFYSDMKTLVNKHSDPLLAAVKIAIAGNIVDYGAFAGQISTGSLNFEQIVKDTINRPFAHDDYSLLKKTLKNAKSLLYLVDNAGEIVFDRVLLETIQDFKNKSLDLTVIVKENPFINDAMLPDAEQAGLQTISNLKLKSMTLPIHFSDLFQQFHFFDVIISKGQANYELFNEKAGIFFLLMVKCPIITRDLGISSGEIIIQYSR
ncbi:MAG: DUF89 domain-containing protein [Promethearchaeota archaeon]